MARHRSRMNAGKKVKRKSKKPIDPRVLLPVDSMRKGWDVNKTLKQNYKSLGLAVNPNANIAHGVNKETVSFISKDDLNAIVAGNKELKEIEEKRESERSRGKLADHVWNELNSESKKGRVIEHYMADGEVDVVRQLIAKHGDDYDKMARDMKVNTYQLTARQIEKKCDKYKSELRKNNLTVEEDLTLWRQARKL